jgi:hypothetical protein
VHEGPLLDLAFDYERIAGRIMGGALSFVVDRARESVMHARDPEDVYVSDEGVSDDGVADESMPDDGMPPDAVQDEVVLDDTVPDDAVTDDVAGEGR